MKRNLLQIGLIIIMIAIVTGCGKKDININKTREVKIINLNLSIPEALKITTEENDYYNTYEYVGKDVFCNISTISTKNSEFYKKSVEDELNLFLLIEDTEGATQKKTINNNEWTYATSTSEFGIEHEGYAIEKNNVIYTIVSSHTQGYTICSDALDKTIESASFTKK